MKSAHFNSLKAIIYLMIVLVGFAIFMIFYSNRDSIVANHTFPQFMIFATIGLALLAGLLYLVSNSEHKETRGVSAKSSKSKSSKRKKRSR